MLTTRASQCWRRARARPRRGGCGPTCAMTDRRATRPLPGCGLRTRPIAEGNTPGSICARFRVLCRPMPMPASISCIKMVGFRKSHVGRTFAASSMISNKPMARPWPGKPWNGSQLYTWSRMRFVDGLRKNENKFANPELDLCSSLYTTAAIRYALTLWVALTRYCDDGRLEIDNNAAERALRAVTLGRKNYLFAGSDAGGERAAVIYSLIGSAKLNGLDPEAYLREVLTRIADHPINR